MYYIHIGKSSNRYDSINSSIYFLLTDSYHGFNHNNFFPMCVGIWFSQSYNTKKFQERGETEAV